jgi:malonate transporter
MTYVLNNVLPVFALLALGKILMRSGLAGEAFFKTSDKLVYFIFFPALLFWKIGNAGPDLIMPVGLILAVLFTITLTWLASLIYIRLAKVTPFQAGSFSQVSYRFNTYIGMAVVLGAFGEAGVAQFGIIISFSIPFLNVLVVGTLVWFSQADYTLGDKVKMLLRGLAVNPLILACLAGIAYARLGPPLHPFVNNTLSLLSSITLPMALLSIGASLALEKLRGRMQLSMVSCVLKLIFMPLVGYTLLKLMGVAPLSMSVAMVFFALPTATSAYILSTQMNSDADLAGASIVLSTLLSFISLSLSLAWFT